MSKLYASRDFTDAGIEKNFTAGDDLSNEPGLENYKAAGVTTDQKPAADTKSGSTKADPAA